MVDPLQGFKADSRYQSPASALLEHPGLWLVVAGFGALLALVSPRICYYLFEPSRCTADVRLLGFAIAGLGVVTFVMLLIRRRTHR